MTSFLGGKRRVPLLLLALVLAANLAMLAWFICFGHRHGMHSDSAVMNLLAQEIVETGSYFPPEWYYVNNDLWVAFTHTLALPLLAFLPNGMAVHAGVGLLATALILHGTWMMGGALGQSTLARVAALVVVSAGWSSTLAETLYGQAAYGLLYAMAAYLFAFTLGAAEATGTRRWRHAACAGLVLLLALWANPQRGVAQYGLPLLAAGAVLALRAGRLPRRPGIVLGLALIACAAAGAALHAFTLRHTTVAAGLTKVSYVTLDEMLANVARTFRGFLTLLEAVPLPQAVATSLYGVGAAGRLLGALLLALVVLPWAVRLAWRHGRPALTAALTYALVPLAMTLYFMLTTTLADPTAPDGSIRYLVIPLLCLVVMTTGLVVDHRGPVRPVLLMAGAVLALLALSGPIAYRVPDARLFDVRTPTRADALLDFLRQHELAYGYGSFWNASHYSVLSAGAVRIRPVHLDTGLPVPMRHLSSARWYQPETWQGRTFLLLSEADAAALKPDVLARYVGAPQQELRFENWRILVYPHNLARDLPGWDISYSRPLLIQPHAETPRQVGRYDADAGALVAEPGQAGLLAFGPWISARAGRYVATFEFATDRTGNAGSVDVVSTGGRMTHAARPLDGTGGKQQLDVPFTLDTQRDMIELRVQSSGTARLALYRVTLRRAP
ncbi:hypothetical protein [Massilia sp. YMA4]|uniref:hypothetical protein n=1 Tax=Massilia sp. YMA4 TaxID=1593482 RepID=UPI000DD11C9F|nr:hypothetical protein [Massilia sp. YMA4]AXA94084.1 hypothetical protein DPH57_24880 [Massilia sp. YMA4]